MEEDISKKLQIKEEISFDTIDSTQLYARKYIDEKNPKDIVLITSEEQTSGLGRHGRTWHSPKSSNIYSTLIIPTNFKSFGGIIPLLPILTCTSVSQTLDSFGCNTQIKWINDVLVNDKKISGTLIETIMEGDLLFVLIGIGVNVNMEKENMDSIDQPTTSMRQSKDGKEFDKSLVLKNLMAKLLANLNLALKGDRSSIVDYVNSHLAYKNCKVKIIDKYEKEEEGEVQGVDENGYLLLKTNENIVKTIYDGRLFPSSDN